MKAPLEPLDDRLSQIGVRKQPRTDDGGDGAGVGGPAPPDLQPLAGVASRIRSTAVDELTLSRGLADQLAHGSSSERVSTQPVRDVGVRGCDLLKGPAVSVLPVAGRFGNCNEQRAIAAAPDDMVDQDGFEPRGRAATCRLSVSRPLKCRLRMTTRRSAWWLACTTCRSTG